MSHRMMQFQCGEFEYESPALQELVVSPDVVQGQLVPSPADVFSDVTAGGVYHRGEDPDEEEEE